ncbi:delta-endotoxin CytB [Ganoderma leucocontextum]|nr:delta-endotoxin CytB [Ganoderma leucocontextum]
MSDRPFDEFFKLPGPLIPAAAKIMKLSNAYVVFNDAQKVTGFNWGGFKDAVVAHPGPNLAFDKLQSTLDKKESSGWFSSHTNESHGSSWEYRIVFALPNPDYADWFYSTIKLTADILEARGWFGLTGESRHNFTATAMELVVNKSYAYTS